MEQARKKNCRDVKTNFSFYVTPRTVRYPKNDNVNMKCHINNNN